MRLEQRCQLFNPVQDGEDRPAQKHQVAGDRCADWIGGGDIDRSAIQSYLQMRGTTVPTDNLAGELRSVQSKAGGSADEARAHDCDALDGHRSFALTDPTRPGWKKETAGPSTTLPRISC